MKPVFIGRLARVEIDDALARSRARNPVRASLFERTINEAMATIAANPQAVAVVSRRGDRQYVLKRRFPYSVVYVDDPDMIRVVAFAHHKRRPGYWKRRLRQP